MDAIKPYFTVFTPTYNRANRLHRVYDSLNNQTMKDFEWLIIDDGSTDNTREVVDAFISKNEMQIRYIWQENGHKKKAFNHGVKKAKGFLFIPADSDDAFDADTLQTFKEVYEKQSEEVRSKISGIVCLCKDEYGNIIGDKYPSDEWLSDGLEMRYSYSISGEKWGCIKTNILRSYPFPDYVEGHVPEGVIWTPIAKKYKAIFINKPLRTYFTNESDSITHSSCAKKNAHGAYLLAKTILEHEFGFFFKNPFAFIKAAANYTRFKLSIQPDVKKKTTLSLEQNRLLGGGLVLLCSPLGFLLYLRDSCRWKKYHF